MITRARGAAYVEVLVIVGVVVTLGLAAIMLLGNGQSATADKQAQCIQTFACGNGSASKGGDLSGMFGTPQEAAPAAAPVAAAAADPYAQHSVAATATNQNGNDFKALFAQYQNTPQGLTGKIGVETLTHTGDNGRQFGLDLGTASATVSSTHVKGSASVVKMSYGQNVFSVPAKIQGTLFGADVNLGYKGDKNTFGPDLSAKADLLSAELQVGKLDPTKGGDIRGGVKVGVGIGAKLKFAIKDEDGDGLPELHVGFGLGLGPSVEGNIVIESTPATAPYVKAIIGYLSASPIKP